ncbi:isoaspartyl peptidase/L-asparaginase family protein [Algimonas porphyrae]|uniref:L-asparaginase n=1 Tax=Algimonas porphyrae TaxID=1128113 RepID=A0ABQ5V1D1_9PROT|nr:isoaspartyl peptidase/L-asparaginase [Algimonas porphyrae]GLQ21360.1 L-asparaginase [Algimonas porphyrae]
MTYALVIHGGAGAQPGTDYTVQMRHMRELLNLGEDRLRAGDSALDVVTEMVEQLELSGLYVAGKGSAPNTDGQFELDASIMDGSTRRAGAVSAIENMLSPIRAARLVLDDGKHVMMTGRGARDFALANGLDSVDDPDGYYTEHEGHGSGAENADHGTVGAVALDMSGHLAAATSTGGIFNKRPGRVGDTPLIGIGTWADDQVAISCTGHGEPFIRACAAYDIAAQMRYGGIAMNSAAHATLAKVKALGGDGGVIAIDRTGQVIMPYNSDGMKRAAIATNMTKVVRVFEPEP